MKQPTAPSTGNQLNSPTVDVGNHVALQVQGAQEGVQPLRLIRGRFATELVISGRGFHVNVLVIVSQRRHGGDQHLFGVHFGADEGQKLEGGYEIALVLNDVEEMLAFLQHGCLVLIEHSVRPLQNKRQNAA